MIGKDPSLIFRHWFTLKAPVNAIATLFEVIKPRKRRNCQLETNLFLESLIQLVRLACSVREIYQPYPSQFCDVEQHYQIRARATK